MWSGWQYEYDENFEVNEEYLDEKKTGSYSSFCM